MTPSKPRVGGEFLPVLAVSKGTKARLRMLVKDLEFESMAAFQRWALVRAIRDAEKIIARRGG